MTHEFNNALNDARNNNPGVSDKTLNAILMDEALMRLDEANSEQRKAYKFMNDAVAWVNDHQ